MTHLSWSSSASGDWATAGNWSTGMLPTSLDDVTIAVAGITVSVGSGVQAANSLVTSQSTLAITGGELDITSYAILGGAFAESAGTLSLGGSGATFNGGYTQTGGMVDLTNGSLTTTGSFALSGGTILQTNGAIVLRGPSTLSGTGVIDQTGGVLDTTGAFAIGGGALNFYATGSGGPQGANFYGNVTQTGGSIDLAVGTLTAYAGFAENGGTVLLNFGGGTFDGPTTLTAGTIRSTAAVMQVNGGYTQTGGLLALQGRGGIFAGPMVLGTAGTVTLALGALQTEGVASLAGTISGQGSLLVDGGTTTLAAGIALSLPHLDVAAGTLALSSALQSYTLGAALDLEARATLSLGGDTLTLSTGGVLAGELVGHGVLDANAGATLNGLSVEDSAQVNLLGTSTLLGGLALGGNSDTGATAVLDVKTGGVLRLTGNDVIGDASSKGLLTVAGVLEKTGGSTLAVIDSNFANTGETLINGSQLELAGRRASLGGRVLGSGTLVLGAFDTTLAAGLVLGVRRVELTGSNGQQVTLGQNLAYANLWDQEGGTLVLAGASTTLSLTGGVSLQGGLIAGAGAIATTGTVSLDAIDIEGSTRLSVATLALQTGTVDLGNTLGQGAQASIAAGAAWLIERDASITGSNGTVLNAGLLEKRNGAAASTLGGTLASTGTLDVNAGTLVLTGQDTLGGLATGAGVLALGGTATLSSGLTLSVGHLILGGSTGVTTLGGNLADAQAFSLDSGELLLAGNTLTLSGTAVLDQGVVASGPFTEGGAIVSTGPLIIDGSASQQLAINNGVSLLADGATEQVHGLTLGDPQQGFGAGAATTLVVGAGATYTMDADASITGNGTLSVLGTVALADAAFSNAATISAAVIDQGLIAIGSAQLAFQGALTGGGSISLGAAGFADFAGAVSASDTVLLTGGSASLLIEHALAVFNGTPDPLAFAATIGGFASGDFIELGELNASSTTLSFSASGTTVSVSDGRSTAALSFSTAQTASALTLGISNGYVTLFHS